MRIISRLDIKNDNLIKAIMFDGVKQLGDPETFAQKYFENGIDELMIINNTGSLYNTKLNTKLLKRIRIKKPIPISAGGGISNYDDAMRLIESGADKIVINSLFHKDVKEAKKIVDTLGASSVTGAIQYEIKNGEFLTYYEMARESTNLNLNKTINFYADCGVGEVLLSNISNDGCFVGLGESIKEQIYPFYQKLPILLGGGFANLKEIKVYKELVSGIVVSSAFHYGKILVNEAILASKNLNKL